MFLTLVFSISFERHREQIILLLSYILEIYDAYEIEVKNPYGFVESSVIISCEISPPIASSYVNIIGWIEKVNNQITQLDLRKFYLKKKTEEEWVIIEFIQKQKRNIIY